jgi:hypothetical protein
MDAATEAELRKINKLLGDSGGFLKGLYESLVEGLITPDEYTAMKAGYEAKITEYSERADELRGSRRENIKSRKERYDIADAASEAVCGRLLTARLVDALIEKITVYPDKHFEIAFRFKDEFREVRRVG